MAGALLPPLRLLAFETIDSTNDEARRRALAGAPEGTAVAADAQTAGRGRQGRRWDSPPGNLYCSLLLRPGCSAAKGANLSFAAALAVADAIEPVLPDGVELHFKWPNDVLLNGKKVAGILLESEIKGERLEWIVVGVGVNVARFPADAMYPATSLAAMGCRNVTVREVMEPYLDYIRVWYGRWQNEGFEPLRAAWLARAEGLGRMIEVGLGAERIRGTFMDLDSDGALVLESEGSSRRITAGDVFFAAPGPAHP
ncbi:MAG TPA: biotin--[acetyl-CoA-carboxylase] ligase [Alphaproteobacteria bacterium]|jgi:BirA family biotin operon repressor/biotin-[acetyl-CoA-carboxylase] ligase|nr:biotin--[acetyl-CoA-carboxylase] ligase [Alphaproteobacteria bacterium]